MNSAAGSSFDCRQVNGWSRNCGSCALYAGDFVMMRKMLLGIKERAERQTHLANLSVSVS